MEILLLRPLLHVASHLEPGKTLKYIRLVFDFLYSYLKGHVWFLHGKAQIVFFHQLLKRNLLSFKFRLYFRILDPSKYIQYDHFLKVYADVLYRWGMRNQYAHIMKHVTIPPEPHAGIGLFSLLNVYLIQTYVCLKRGITF